MDEREQRGLYIARTAKIVETPVGYRVQSQSGKGSYVVKLDPDIYCTCRDFETRQQPCKHIQAVRLKINKDPRLKEPAAPPKRPNYPRDWSAYNKAQTHEEEWFVEWLRELCAGIPEPAYKFGRPRAKIGDVLFTLIFKTYRKFPGRRLVTSLKDKYDQGFTMKVIPYNTAFGYIEDKKKLILTPILQELVKRSAIPAASLESFVAVDSTGFSTSCYNRWLIHNPGEENSAKWVKMHLVTGVVTHIVPWVIITGPNAGDSTQFRELVAKANEIIRLQEVSADGAYSGKDNLDYVNKIGATPYIPFKKYGMPELALADHSGGTYWDKMWLYFNFSKAEFLSHYHRRSNVETTFSMIKRKFGADIVSKKEIPQVNEALCKIICHNICVTIQAMYEFGLDEPAFRSKSPCPPSIIFPSESPVHADAGILRDEPADGTPVISAPVIGCESRYNAQTSVYGGDMCCADPHAPGGWM